MLHAKVRARRGEFNLDVDLTAEPRHPLVVVGESGAGKTTFLEMLAGLIHPDDGSIVIDNDYWFDGAHPNRLVAAHQRSVGYVAQEPTLFPHLTVIENVAFGLRASGAPARAALARARDSLHEIDLTGFENRKPSELSGGQRQRVTLARALCLEPRLLLLDEPLSSLDVRNKQSMRTEIRRVVNHLKCITVYVTHDPLEALTIGDRIAVIENGSLTQVDNRAGLLREPRSQYVGRFVGINVFRGTADGRLDSGIVRVTVDDGTLHVVDVPDEGEFFVAIDPRNVTLSLEAPAGSAQNVFQGEVEEVTPTLPGGETVRVQLKSTPPLVAEVTRHAAEKMGLAPGVRIHAAVKATAITTYQ